jgi:signal transduction histidine kinase
LRREVTELRASRERLAVSNDAERRGIERALHDGVQQHLVGLDTGIALVAGTIDTDPAEAKRLLAEVGRDLKEALEESRKLAHRVYPPLLEAGGLRAALRSAAVIANVPIRIDVAGSASYPPGIASAVYRCCIDLIERAAATTEVGITVRDEGGTLAFEIVADADVGAERLPLRDRIEALGGRLTIEGSGGETRAVGSLPLPEGG